MKRRKSRRNDRIGIAVFARQRWFAGISAINFDIRLARQTGVVDKSHRVRANGKVRPDCKECYYAFWIIVIQIDCYNMTDIYSIVTDKRAICETGDWFSKADFVGCFANFMLA